MDKILTIILVFSAVFFLYNKFRMWRTPESLLKRVYQSKGTLFLGVFLICFGANLLIMPRGVVDIVVGSLFAILGIANGIYGYKSYRHYDVQLEN